MVQKETKVHEADNVVKKYMFGTIIGGMVPIPFVDMLVVSGLQLKMLHRLANLYSVEFSENLGKSLIASLLGSGVPFSFSRNVMSLTKKIPFYGQTTGIVSMAIFSGASTYAIGKVFIQHFESGGTFLTFDPKKVSDYYAQQFEKGKEAIKGGPGIKP